MSQPLVSLLLPSIGRLEFIEHTIQSVRRQSFRDFEVIVLDNASPADAADTFTRWAGTDSRVRISRVDERIPMFSNFKRGITQAAGKYVAFFHDDDSYSERLLEEAVRALEANRSAAFFGSNYDFIDLSGHVSERRRWIARDGLIPGRAYIRKLLYRGRNLVAMPGLVFQRDLLGNCFDERISAHFGDFVLLMRMAEEGDVYLSTAPLVSVRRHAQQTSEMMPKAAALEMRTALMLAYCDEYEARHGADAAFVRRARRRIEVLRRGGLAWAWATASGSDEAAACLHALGRARVLRAMLSAADAVGMRKLARVDPVRASVRRLISRAGF